MTQAGRATRARHPIDSAAVAAAYDRAEAARWQVSRETFAAAIVIAVEKRFEDPAAAGPAAVEAFIATLHAADLALACACRDGHPDAWDHFVLTYRPELYRAARAIAGEGGRELADSLYGELFGLAGDDGERRSLLRYYQGRSRLGTWLRSVLAQRHVDAIRASRRLSSIDDPDQHVPEPAAAAPALEPDAAARMRVAAGCVSAAIERLDAPSRLRLAYYYVHGLTLAEAGRLLGEHEATASRKLEKARAALRGLIETALAGHGLRASDVESWGEVARQAWDAALAEALAVDAPTAAGLQAPAVASFKVERTP